MEIKLDNEKPIFIQISEYIEDAIITGAFPEETQIPSITEFSVKYKINPATALKGINILVENGSVYKKRGVGMFVSKGASTLLKQKRIEIFYEKYITALFTEAKRLGLTKNDIMEMIERENNYE